MSRAIYHRGLTIESDPKKPVLSIEGQDIPIQKTDGQYQSKDYPELKADTPEELAKLFIERSPEYEQRRRIRTKHIDLLKKGVERWNRWRRKYPHIRPTLYDLDFREAGINPDLSGINFSNADLRNANLDGTILVRANFHETNLGSATLRGAKLQNANFCRTDLYRTDLSGADLTDANLQGTQLAWTSFAGAKLIGCTIYGLSAWDLDLEGAIQKDLNIIYREFDEGPGEDKYSNLFVDDIQVAQFIYLLLHNKQIRDAIDTITSKVVLILGRFKPGRAHLARFVIADVTEPRIVIQEIPHIVDNVAVPVQPILLHGHEEGELITLADLRKNHRSLLDTFVYENEISLINNLEEKIIEPAEELFKQLNG
ncbi:MAG: pentapeptide repeat-containing protein [Thermoanaerobaculia bacterium]|nr:pentapeptide repeat-containing protein [Thermoanaerobaculia bacterium]